MSVVVQTQSADATAAADDPLLSYTVTTTPSPLKASPENPQVPEETGEVVISVARQNSTPADVEWIKVKVPAGTMAPDLATDLAKISPRISLTGWTVRLDTAAKEFVFEPAASHAPIGPDNGFTLQLSDIPMSRKVGTAPVTVTESSREGNAAFKDRKTVFNLGKFPADFYLRNFLCEPSIIHNGGDVHLTWERSANATYELLYPGTNRDVTDRTSLPLEGVKSDTTFYLRATAGDPTSPVVRILSAQVTVIKPDLRARLVEADALYAPGTHLRHIVLDTATGNWSAPVWIPVGTTDPSPSLASFGGRLRCSYFDGELRHWVGWDGKDWEYEELTLARRSRSAPAFSGPDGWIECAHGDREDFIDLYRSTDGGLTWGRLLAPQRQWNSTSPLAWGKTDGGWSFFLYRKPDDTVHFVHLQNDGSGGSRWNSKTLNDAISPFGVSAVAKGDDGTPAHCLLATEDGAMYLRSASYFEWGSPARVADFRTISKPVLLSVAGKFHCFFRDSSGVRWTTSTNRGQSWSGALLVPGAEASTRAPAVAQHDGYLHLVF